MVRPKFRRNAADMIDHHIHRKGQETFGELRQVLLCRPILDVPSERRDRVKDARIFGIMIRDLENLHSAEAKRIAHGDIVVEEIRFQFPSVDLKRRELRWIAVDMDMAIAGA